MLRARKDEETIESQQIDDPREQNELTKPLGSQHFLRSVIHLVPM
jgi:hypothetical protein